MRERLAQLLRSKSCWNNDCPEGGCEKCDYIGINDETAEQIADYLIANGVVVPPCKIRTKVYKIVLGKIYEYEIASYTVDAEGFSFIHLAYMEGNTIYGVTHSIEEFNKQYYLAREDAERALKGDKE